MFEIIVEDSFSAGHFLKLYDGSFEPKHGHDFRVAVLLRSKGLDSIGVVADFEEVRPCLRKVMAELDGALVNEHPDFKGGKLNPSTENLAKVIYSKLSKLYRSDNARIAKVTVWETPDAQASYCPE